MRRELTPELMDDPGLDPQEHRRALTALARLNRLSRAEAIIRREVAALAGRSDEPVSALDVATGSGDLPVALALRLRDSVRVSGCDISDTALATARERAASRGVEVDLWRHDALAQPIPGRFDVVTCSLFLHHLDRESGVRLMRHMADAATRVVLISDLRRDRAGLALAWAASRVCTRSRVVRVDAVKSVRAAFKPTEVLEMAREAGLGSAEILPRWPRRMLLRWDAQGGRS